jgi:catechol 2,3-dioxygenase-like lactoylglutathione lyase family enzyme
MYAELRGTTRLLRRDAGLAAGGRNIIFIDAGSTTIELIERDEPLDLARQGFAHFAFHVADIDAAYAELTAKGIVFHVLPKPFPPEQPSVRLAFFKDPDGNELELVQPLTEGYPQPMQS